MSAELWILTATAVLAVVAISAALIAVRAAQLSRNSQMLSEPSQRVASAVALIDADEAPTKIVNLPERIDSRLEPRIVEGRLIVPPTQQQVVTTVLSRPGVRLSVFAHGVTHALRAESRDRISALMRREYRRRRRQRLQAGRRAVRDTSPSPAADEWLGS